MRCQDKNSKLSQLPVEQEEGRKALLPPDLSGDCTRHLFVFKAPKQ